MTGTIVVRAVHNWNMQTSNHDHIYASMQEIGFDCVYYTLY